jgi:hypothetical protein
MMAEENDNPGSGSEKSGGNVFTRKLGPLPMWAWMGIGLGGALAVTSWSKNKKAAAAAAAGPNPNGTLPSQQTASGSTPASLIPQFVNQVYNQETPPAATPPAATPPDTSPVTSFVRTVLNPIFNEVGWSDKAKQSPWKQVVALPGESWKDVTARVYGFASNYAAITDPKDKARVDSVSDYLKRTNADYTGQIPGGYGPTPGSIVTYR